MKLASSALKPNVVVGSSMPIINTKLGNLPAITRVKLMLQLEGIVSAPPKLNPEKPKSNNCLIC